MGDRTPSRTYDAARPRRFPTIVVLLCLVPALAGAQSPEGDAVPITADASADPLPSASGIETPAPAVTSDDTATDIEPPPDLSGSGDLGTIEELDLEDLLSTSIVTASKREEATYEAPSIVTVFSRAELDRLGVTRLIDLLRLTPGFVEVSAPMERNIASRGIHATTSQNIVVLIDGLRMNDFLANTAAPDGFLLGLAEQVEIIRGPGAALYGSNALTGVVNIITRSPDKAPSFAATAGYSTAHTLHLSAQHSAKLGEDGSVFAWLAYTHSEGTRYRVPGSEDVLIARLGQNTADGLQQGETATQPRSSVPVWANRYGPSFEGFVKYTNVGGWVLRVGAAHKEFFPQRSELGSLLRMHLQSQRPVRSDSRASVDFTRFWGDPAEYGKITVRPAIQLFRHGQRSQVVPESAYDIAANEGRVAIVAWDGNDLRTSLNVDYSKDFGDIAFIRDLSLLTGIQLEYSMAFDYRLSFCEPDAANDYEPSAYDEERTGHDYVCFRGAPMLNEGVAVDRWGNRVSLNRPHLGDGDDILGGYFFQLDSKLPGNFALTLGGRVDYNPDYDAVFTPRVAVVNSITKNFYVKALYASAFVYPPFLYRTGNRQANIIGNPDMVPESIQTFEILGGFRMPNFRADVNGFVNIVKDFITFDEERFANSQRYFYDNRGDLYILGAEASLAVALWNGRLGGKLGLAVSMPLDATDPEFLVDGELGGPSKFPPFSGSATVYTRPWDFLTLNVTAVFATPTKLDIQTGKAFTDITANNGTALSSKVPGDYSTGYFNLDAAVSFRFIDDWQVSVVGSNLIPVTYHLPGATVVPYVRASPELMLSVSYAFAGAGDSPAAEDGN